MSKLAKKPIILPKAVEAKIEGSAVTVKGPKGEIRTEIPQGVEVRCDGKEITVNLNNEPIAEKARFGLCFALIANAVEGVSKGYEKKLSLIGVGYRANMAGNKLDLSLGFSHPCQIAIPQGVNVAIEKNILITITGIDKKLVGQFAADVRMLKPPEPYKGKGIRYEGEHVRKKDGKAAKGK